MRLLLALVLTAAAWAQTSDLLERIKQHALAELATAPNYVCVDSIERSVWIPRQNRYRLLDRIHVELSHVDGADRFAWLGNSAFESRTLTAMVGHGASFAGDFADNRALLFKNDRVTISYAGRVTMDGRDALRYAYDAPRGALRVSQPRVSGYAPAQGSFWIDPDTLDLLQIDMQGYAIPSRLALRSISNHTTYWRVLIGERTALLPRDSEFRLINADGSARRNLSVFSNCREYTAASTLSFGASATPQPAASAGPDARLKPGLQLDLVLDKPIDSTQAAVGDPVRARVLKGDRGIPRGAHVYGRVLSIVNFDDQAPLPVPQKPAPPPKQTALGHAGQVLIELEFLQIDDRHTRAPFIARLIDVDSQPAKHKTEVLSFGYLDYDAVVRYDPPGTASLYVSKEYPVLDRNVILRWVTAVPPGASTRSTK